MHKYSILFTPTIDKRVVVDVNLPAPHASSGSGLRFRQQSEYCHTLFRRSLGSFLITDGGFVASLERTSSNSQWKDVTTQTQQEEDFDFMDM